MCRRSFPNNRKAPARHKAEEDYILTTRLYCGKCGAMAFGESGKGRSDTVYCYYKCANTKQRKTCDKKPVQKEWLEDLVVNSVMELVMDDAAVEAIVAMLMDLQSRENSDLPFYEKQLAQTETAIQNMLNAIQMGILTPSTKERLEQPEETKADLKIKIASEQIERPRLTEDFLTFWLHKFRKLNPSRLEDRKC